MRDFQIEKDTIIIPLHSPKDNSPEELVVSDSNCNVTKAVVHVSYEPKQVESEPAIILNENNITTRTTSNQIETLKKSVDKINTIGKVVKNTKLIKDDIENGHKTTNNLMKLEDSSLSPRLNR